jgi:hypothetical protein
MRTSLAAVTALTGSLLLPFLMLGSAQAVTSAPDLKKVMSTTHVGTVMPVRAGGGGGFVGGGGHMGGMGGGHMGGMGGRMGGFAGRGVHGPMVAGRGFNNGHFNNRHFVNDRHFNNRHFVNDRHFRNRRFVNNRFFVAGGPWWWGDYNNSCWWWTGRRWVWACY